MRIRGLDWSDLGYGQMACCCDKCNEAWGFIKCKDLVTGWRRIRYSRMTLLHAFNFEYRMFIVVTIRHQLSLNRLVSTSSNSLFKGFRSHLHPFRLQFSIIFGALLLFILVTCRSQFDLHLLSFSAGSTFNYSNNFFSPCAVSKAVHGRISEIFNLVWYQSFIYFFFLRVQISGPCERM